MGSIKGMLWGAGLTAAGIGFAGLLVTWVNFCYDKFNGSLIGLWLAIAGVLVPLGAIAGHFLP